METKTLQRSPARMQQMQPSARKTRVSAFTAITLYCDMNNDAVQKALDLFLSLGMFIKAKDNQPVDIYQHLYGKREDNKYTDSEIFVANSKLNASKSFAKYL